ncbi:3,4-dihydroxy 2-butanone 4-phosphate synthase / GTP cyclohydrolase II [Pontimonas salivibrio]|uniref:GTP cyclohydrolase-2 n=1 Tax=Pontimonas salivibrio TaxID=1159327 RepID=A0A2L2BSK3_9MICO|nr:GTP cyclohydrolase II [Pontimonas salivibrio]AVG24617.1 3,4-dihydroxy 2-butanone 4-phosphate synthase / GTP cyclohydrolase II [Pontimonas salivibrio]
MAIGSIPEALNHLRQGRPIIVVDDEARENEGDIVLAADLATPEWVGWAIRHSSGYLCAPMPSDWADRLQLPLMVRDSEDPRRTAYGVSVDAAAGVSTGISASDRTRTLRVLADPHSKPTDLIRPGHILPLRASTGGLMERPGHTEATVSLLAMAGLQPVGMIGEVVGDDGELLRLPELLELGEREGVPVITIEQLIASGEVLGDTSVLGAMHQGSRDQQRVIFEVETDVPTEHGTFTLRAYRDRATGADHVAIVSGEPHDGMLVRLHSECLTGEAMGSLKCECGPQLRSAMETIHERGGAVIYLRGHEGRGIGLINKLRAYRLQESGLDTLDANLALGLPADARDYGAAAAILKDMDISEVKLLSNNPEKKRQLEQHGITVSESEPLVVGIGADNFGYLEAKRDRMGHTLPGQLETGAIPIPQEDTK